MIGLGKMGILHSGILNSLPNARLTAICEKQIFFVRAAKTLVPKTITFYDDHIKMVENEELGAIFVTTPISTHAELVADLARADKNLSIFVEKPLGATHEQAQLACNAARSLRGIHMVGFQKRFSPVFQKAREFIGSGLIGEPLFFRAHSFSSDVLRRGRSWRFKSGSGGVLLDLAPHLLDLLLWFFGQPTSILAVRRSLYSTEVDDYAHVVMEFGSDLKGHMDTCWSIGSFRLPEVSVEIFGRDGILTVTDDFVKVGFHKETTHSSQAGVYYKPSFNTSVAFLLADPEFTREDEAFLAGIDNHTMPDLSFYEAAKVNAIIDEINKNAS